MIQWGFETVSKLVRGKSVVVVGSAPSGLENTGHFIDSHDVVVRVNNYKTHGVDKKGVTYDFRPQLGSRTDIHYSYYGGAIRKSGKELKRDGIKAHMCKCPNDVCHVTEWHKQNNQIQGGDFRPIYRRREGYWIKPVYIPKKEHYMKLFHLLDKHVPSTGLAAVWEMINMEAKSIYITGFDFMDTPLHNVNERWLKGREDDPIGHDWKREKTLCRRWVTKNSHIDCDDHLKKAFKK
jgi:hypothetical protein